MRPKWHGGLVLVVGSIMMLSTTSLITSAFASTVADTQHPANIDTQRPTISRPSNNTGASERSGSKHTLSKSGKARYARAGGGLQCVTFARAASGIALKGNAANWWDAAAGVYQRGNAPEPGSVLNFRANGHMRLGHVAVVTQIVTPREIEIDHANWAAFGASKGNVSRGIRVLDVSAKNDWSAVRVGLGHSEDFGSVYPTYGFIYDRPDNGTMFANRAPVTHVGGERPAFGLDEVAEAPPLRSIPASLPVDAPDHSFR